MDLAKEMRVRNVERNVHTYTALMNVCIKCGNCPLALDTYHHMRQDGTYPNVVTYNTLIECALMAFSHTRYSVDACAPRSKPSTYSGTLHGSWCQCCVSTSSCVLYADRGLIFYVFLWFLQRVRQDGVVGAGRQGPDPHEERGARPPLPPPHTPCDAANSCCSMLMGLVRIHGPGTPGLIRLHQDVSMCLVTSASQACRSWS